MESWIYWAVTFVVGLMVTGLGFFFKKMLADFAVAMKTMREDFQNALAERDKRIEKLEMRLQDTLDAMPYKYTLRDDFIRAMSAVEVKLNKILDKLTGLGPQ